MKLFNTSKYLNEAQSHRMMSTKQTDDLTLYNMLMRRHCASTGTSPLRHPYFKFKRSQTLKFSQIYLFQDGKFMDSYKIGLLPNVFKEMFSLTNQVHSYNNRNSNTFYLFPARTNVKLFGMRFQGPKFSSSLNHNIQLKVVKISLSRLKTFLLS